MYFDHLHIISKQEINNNNTERLTYIQILEQNNYDITHKISINLMILWKLDKPFNCKHEFTDCFSFKAYNFTYLWMSFIY